MSIIGKGIPISRSVELKKFYYKRESDTEDTFFFEEGMTFNDWIGSPYNVQQSNMGSVWYVGGRGRLITSDITSSDMVYYDDIEENAIYRGVV